MKKVSILLIIFILNVYQLMAQVELQKIAPLSPNAAAITKYGEIPVGYFTGVPSISVPLYTIQSRELSLPLTLSYHGGGIKVEENSSWVGLGWSLGSIPSISRQVNGLADELGYNSNVSYDGYSMKEIEDSVILAAPESWVESFRRQIFASQVDPEADIYFFSLLGKSGKFWWNQETSSFVTYPKSEVKIELTAGTFRITDEDGTIYLFTEYETSQSSGSQSGPTLRSAWYTSKIYNFNRTDSINFSYGSATTTSKTIAPYTYTIYGSCPSSDLTNTTVISIKYPDSIWFNNGYAKFTVQGSSRQDYNGGYALDKLKIYNSSNSLIKAYNFGYHYMSSTDNSGLCGVATGYEKKRLMLDEVDLIGANNVSVSKHSFLYDSTIASPCKVSAAQDYWGFYNGKTSNGNLIPSTAMVLSGGSPQLIGSADRRVDTAYSQFGILRRVIYPTGGYSDFEYENNKAGNNPSLPATFTVLSAALQGEAPEPITTDTYIDTFTVNNVANTHLNSNLGGAFLYAEIGAYGCDLSGGSSSCASFTIRGIDGTNSSYYGTVLPGNTQGWYVPNGNYEIKATFDQDTPAYDEFWFYVSWLAFDSLAESNAYNRNVGGLRIKKIQSYDQFGHSISRRYKYTTGFASDTSSGEIFGRPHFVVEDNTYTTSGAQCFALHADPNALSVTHSGSYIGYKRVFELMDSTGIEGMSEYHFTTAAEGIVSTSPYPPAESEEYLRGLPTLVANYRYKNGSYYPVKKIISEYTSALYDSLRSVSYKLRVVQPPNEATPYIYGQWEDAFYYTTPAWSALSKSYEIVYDQNDTTKYVETVTDYSYNSYNLLAMTKFLNSRGDTVKTLKYYPKDLSLSGTAETARQSLISKNNISTILKQEQLSNSTIRSEIKSNYKLFGTKVMTEELFQKRGAGTSESRIKFLKYDSYGNLISQQKTGDMVISYIYDYSNRLPVAEVENADSSSIAFTSFEADGKGGWTYSGTVSGTYFMTGSKSYNLSGGNITRAGLSNATYIISYWSKSGSVTVNSSGSTRTGKTVGDWTYYEHEVTGTSITVSGSVYIDELRLCPKGAVMKTFTHTPLIGVSSESDANGHISFYEYDSMGRLFLVKDEEGKIIRRIEYKYKATATE